MTSRATARNASRLSGLMTARTWMISMMRSLLQARRTRTLTSYRVWTRAPCRCPDPVACRAGRDRNVHWPAAERHRTQLSWQCDREKALDHRVHLLRHFQRAEMPRSDRLAIQDLRSERVQAGYVRPRLRLVSCDVKAWH